MLSSTCPWSSWGDCSLTCGGIGVRTKTRLDNSEKAEVACHKSACPTTTQLPTTVAIKNDGFSINTAFPNVGESEILIIGGRYARSDRQSPYIIKSVSLESTEERTLISVSKWKQLNGPANGFHRHCSVYIDGKVFVIGGSFTKRDVYELSSNSITKLNLRLPIDMYLHSCEVFNDRIWACSPGRGQGRRCLSLNNNGLDVREEATLTDQHYFGAMTGVADKSLFIAGGNPRTSSVEILHTENGRQRWVFGPALDLPLSGLELLNDGLNLFAIGGYNGKTSTDIIYKLDISCYVAMTCLPSGLRRWKSISKLLTARDGHRSIFFHSMIYSFGGYSNVGIVDEVFSEGQGSFLLSTTHKLNSFSTVVFN